MPKEIWEQIDINKIDPERRRHIAEIIKMLTEKTDPLDFVKGHKDEEIIKHLRENGIDGFKIQDILLDGFGSSGFHNYSVSYTREERERDKKIEYAMRNINTLCKNSLLTNGEVAALRKIELRLKKISFRFSRDTINAVSSITSDSGDAQPIVFLGSSGLKPLNNFRIKIKKGKASLDFSSDVPYPKSHKQLIGVRMVALFDYFQQFNHGQYIDKEIYGLIEALYKKTSGIEFEVDMIKKFIENNKIIYNKINSSRKTTKSKKTLTSIKS